MDRKTFCGFELATVREAVCTFAPALISIENNDYRGCRPVDWETLQKFYEGTDILDSSVVKIVIDDEKSHMKVWL